MKNNYESLNAILSEAALNLDRAAHMVRDLEFASEINIGRIGEALANVFEIQNQIYALRPELKPAFLKK